jgi:hypothetical protein
MILFQVNRFPRPLPRYPSDLLDLLTKQYLIRAIVQYYALVQKLRAGDYDCPVLESWRCRR